MHCCVYRQAAGAGVFRQHVTKVTARSRFADSLCLHRRPRRTSATNSGGDIYIPVGLIAIARQRFLLAAAVILVRDPTGKWEGDPLQPWFESLRNKAGLYCCAKADGHPLDDGAWDIRDKNYRWAVVPDDALILGPNKLGKAIVWFQP